MSSNEMGFQLVNEQVKEDFSLWDDINKKFIRQLDGVANMDDIKFMKQDLFMQRYPGLRKHTQYIREIIVYDAQQPTQYLFGFKKTANDDLNKAIATNRNLGINPLEVLYNLRKTGQGITTIYQIIAMGRIGLPQNVLQSQTVTPSLQSQAVAPQQMQKEYMQPMQKPMIVPQSVPIKTLETSHIKPKNLLQQGVVFGLPNMQKVVVLQEGAEKEIYEASCNYSKNLTEERYIELWNDCAREYFNVQFEIQRVKDIYNELYVKK